MTPEQAKTILGSLMCAEHLGDVRSTLDTFCDYAGLPRLEGEFDDWTDADWAMVEG